MKLPSFTDEELLLAVPDCESINQLARKLGLKKSTKFLKQKIKELNVDLNHFKIHKKGYSYLEKLKNTTVGDYLILDILLDKGKIKCKCKCGKILTFTLYYFNKCTKSCKSCRLCLKGKNNPNYNGIGDISGTIWKSIKRGATCRNLEFSIDIEFAWNLFLKQDRKCALSGLEIHFGDSNELKTASLDRIDSSKGYTKTNVQWLEKRINIMKSNMTDKEFIDICRIIVEKNK